MRRVNTTTFLKNVYGIGIIPQLTNDINSKQNDYFNFINQARRSKGHTVTESEGLVLYIIRQAKNNGQEKG